MTAAQMQIVSEATAFYPLAVVGGLIILIYISRKNQLKHKSNPVRSIKVQGNNNHRILDSELTFLY